MSESNAGLFEPVQVGRYRMRNRIVMAAMTRNRSPNEVPGDLNVEYYGQRAGAGLIVAESTAISEQGLGWRDLPGIYNAGADRGLEARHRRGACHAAAIPSSTLALRSLFPSRLASGQYASGRAVARSAPSAA